VSTPSIQSHWDEQLAWSVTADRLKWTRQCSRSVVLILSVTGATLSTLAAVLTPSQGRTITGFCGAAALALIPFFNRYFLTAERTSNWLRARSVSEGIKSEIYKFRAAAAPYDQPEALLILTKKVREIRDWGKSLEIERAEAVVAPQKTVLDRLDADGYITMRVHQQIQEYYRPKARRFAVLADRFRTLEMILTGSAAVLGAGITYAAKFNLSPWVAVCTTAAASFAAHAAGGRLDFQATTFFATARQLNDLVLDWKTSGKQAPSKEWSEFVRACEDTISAENRGWMAKLDDKHTD
jgi:hypothetical protein